MPKSLAGKVIAITGGSSGIGLGIVRVLLSYKAKVAVADVQQLPDELSEYLGEEIILNQIDVRSREEVRNWIQEVAQKFGRLDGIVANAGIAIFEGGTGATSDDLFDRVFDVNVKGVWNTVTEAYFQFERQKTAGSIVTTASAAGLRGHKGMPVYSATKHAVIGFTRSWAATWGPQGIRVNAIAPGIISTPSQRQLSADSGGSQAIESITPLGRLGQPNEIGEGVAFLLSDEASYVSGQVLQIDGAVLA